MRESMKNAHATTRQLRQAQLNGLLTLSRELFQTDEAADTLDIVGHTLVELVGPACALLVLGGDQLSIFGFDGRGDVRPAGADHMLYPASAEMLFAADSTKGHGRVDQPSNRVSARTLVVGVPADAAVATLAVAWDSDLRKAQLDQHRSALCLILELAAAALGKIETRCTLQEVVANQRDQIARSSAVHAAELAQKDESASSMRMLSLTDVLTGLLNRRGFFLQAEQVFRVSQRNRAVGAVIFADIDGLKRVNDELGHGAGDGLIRDAATVFRKSFRQADVVARLGGDEFAAYTLDNEQPQAIVARIQANLRAFNVTQAASRAISMSIGGVRCDPGDGLSMAHYLAMADEQMYAQKRRRPL